MISFEPLIVAPHDVCRTIVPRTAPAGADLTRCKPGPAARIRRQPCVAIAGASRYRRAVELVALPVANSAT